MHVIKVRNVAQALEHGLRYIHQVGEAEPSRDGPVLVAPHPVATVYTHPTERVLFDEWRRVLGKVYTDISPFRAVAWSALPQTGTGVLGLQVKAVRSKLKVLEVPVDYHR